MTASDADAPGGEGEQQRPGAVDDALWNELVAAFHASPAPDEGGWPESENLGSAPPARPPEPGQGAGQSPGQSQGPEQSRGPGQGEGPATLEGGAPPARVVRPAVRPGRPAPPAPPSITWIEGVLPSGPRDWTSPDEEEGFTPPTPPPLPELPAATKAAWLAGLGGPAYLALSAILHWDTPSWAALLCVLGGVAAFAYLVSRLKDRPGDDPDDPDDGAIV